MSENVWVEIWNKPAFNFLSYHPGKLLRVSGKISVNEDWLKEVKAEGDRLMEINTLVKDALLMIVDKEYSKMAVARGIAMMISYYQPEEEGEV